MTFPRRILLAVTGLSPQVVTETLYALGMPTETDIPAFIPTEIHLLTTTSGAKLARTALLHPDGGQFHALLSDYPQLGCPTFTESTIHLIRNPQGQALADIRTPTENALAADTITALLAEFTRDRHAALHVSIAGGRKTMGFYLGYAFSLFARPQDELSHVLVTSPFESHPEFFYPPAIPKRLSTRDGHHIDTAEAIITLARIPVVRLRHGQPQALLDGQASFNDTVAAIQQSLQPPQLRIELQTKRVICGAVSVQLPPAILAWYGWWVQLALKGEGAQNWRTANAAEFLALYAKVVGKKSSAYENTEERLKQGMEQTFFQENNSKLEGKLKAQLGIAATPYLLSKMGRRPHVKRSLSLKAESMELIA